MRIKHGVKAPDVEQQLAVALHIVFNSVKKVWDQFSGNHTVFCLEGRSWRKDIYLPYKANRKVVSNNRTPKEVEEDKLFFEVMDEFIKFVEDKTNCTVLRNQNAEADDMIARWIALHPDDHHIIISSDSDFQQLIAPNVKIFNGIAGLLYTNIGIFDVNGNIAKNKHDKDLPTPDPEWFLFEKCMRGDAGDNVMSAYPGVRTKKLREAYEDRHNRGYAWNNLMLSKWTDHDGVDHRVKDDFERNILLIDLKNQPPDLLEKFDTTIFNAIITQPRKQVGLALMRFCNRHGLVKIEKAVAEYSLCLSSIYHGHLFAEKFQTEI